MPDQKELFISIIMPAFNAERTIEASIDSICRQTYPYWELLILDDASSDRTIAIAEQKATSENRIKIFHESTNLGVAAERNKGVQKAQYDWIAFLDSDDCWTEDKLEKQVQMILEYEASTSSHANPENSSKNIQAPSLYYTGSAFMDSKGSRLPYILHVPIHLSASEILKQNLISCSSVLVRRSQMLQHPMPVSRSKPIHEDFATWISILKEGDAIGLDEPLLIYRISANSKSGNKIKSAMMHWNTMRMNNISVPISLWNMCFYIFRNLRKYYAIRKNMTSKK